jgi:hypothetical protein
LHACAALAALASLRLPVSQALQPCAILARLLAVIASRASRW